jgi:hypothetical protein
MVCYHVYNGSSGICFVTFGAVICSIREDSTSSLLMLMLMLIENVRLLLLLLLLSMMAALMSVGFF